MTMNHECNAAHMRTAVGIRAVEVIAARNTILRYNLRIVRNSDVRLGRDSCAYLERTDGGAEVVHKTGARGCMTTIETLNDWALRQTWD